MPLDGTVWSTAPTPAAWRLPFLVAVLSAGPFIHFLTLCSRRGW